MKPFRLAAFAALMACCVSAAERTVFVGTYAKNGSEGIYSLRFDDTTGRLGTPKLAAKADNASFLATDPQRRFLFSYNETGRGTRDLTGHVLSFAVNAVEGLLSEINRRPLEGHAPCHIATDPTGAWLLGANYADGDMQVFPIRRDGQLGGRGEMLRYTQGSGVHPRQATAHPHQVVFDPSGHYVLVPDLGADRIWCNRFDAASGQTDKPGRSPVQLQPGSGPRHLAYHPRKPIAYVVNELSNSVTMLAWDAAGGKLTPFESVSTLPAGYTNGSTASGIEVHSNGRTLYASNRGHDSIVVMALDETTGRPSVLQHMPTGGRTPRHFAMEPAGRFLIAANQDTGTLKVFRIEAATGRLEATPAEAAVPSPSCVLFW